MTSSLLDTDGSPTPVTTFLLVHRALRRDLARFPQAVRRLPADDIVQADRLVHYWRRVRGALDEHHAAEDERLFPALLAAEPALAEVLAVLDRQHAVLDGALAAIDSALAELPGHAAPAAELLSALSTDLDGHLALEEAHLVPVMLRTPGWGTGPGAERNEGGGGTERGWLLAWAAEGLDAETLDALLRALPTDEAEQAPAWRRDHETIVRAVWRDLPGVAPSTAPAPPVAIAPARSRPVGWWLKEADARLGAAFDRRLDGRRLDRRGWQVLASLAAGPAPRPELVASLTAFDPPAVVAAVIAGLVSRGWIEESGGLLRLTGNGQREHLELVPIVGALRSQVAAALPHDDHATLVRLLEQLVTALEPAEA